jgi:hypothetical protein
MVFQVFWEVEQEVIKFLSLLNVLDCLYYFSTLTSVLWRVFYCKGNLNGFGEWFSIKI